MRVLLRLENKMELEMPYQYNHMVESSIYNSISQALADYLHTYGFISGSRSFKLFTFSRLLGNYRHISSGLIFTGDISLLISSPIKRFILELANGVLRRGTFFLGTRKLVLERIYFPNRPKLNVMHRGFTLSPITVYSTMYAPDGSKKTYYYSPYEKEFSRLISDNARRKLSILSKRKIIHDLQFKPIRMKETVVIYKGTVIKGWHGYFQLEGPKSLIDVTYDAGLGSKNSEGFGMYEIVNYNAND